MSDMEIVAVSALRDNYIWSVTEGTRCVVVDPGEAAPVLHFLQSRALHLHAILLTHRHADHQGGVADLLAHQKVPVFGPTSSAMPLVTHRVADDTSIRLEGFEHPVQVLAVPGHTEEHLAYLWADHLFCGDTLFGAGCGRLLGGTAEQLFASLQRLAALPADTQVCCAHEYTLSNLAFAQAVEPANTALAARLGKSRQLRDSGLPTVPSSLREELATNPFLRCSFQAVRDAAQASSGLLLETPQAVFVALRTWKDHF
jgi:hydroxyacylglutathione hydrolase